MTNTYPAKVAMRRNKRVLPQASPRGGVCHRAKQGTVRTNHCFLYRAATCKSPTSTSPAPPLNELWFITWDPTEPVATRPLDIQKDGTWYSAPTRPATQGSPSQVCSGLGGWLLKPHPAYGLDLPKNITEVYGADGTIKTAYTYTPYGQVTANGSTVQPIQWSSEYTDTDLALVYYNYRHYNPLDGRWCGRNRIAEAGGYNLNIYASNLPLNAWDNLGLFLDFLYSDDKGSLKAGTYEVTSPVPVIGGFPFGTVTVGTPNKSDGGKQSITLAIGITWGISFLNKLKKSCPLRLLKLLKNISRNFKLLRLWKAAVRTNVVVLIFANLALASLLRWEKAEGEVPVKVRGQTPG